MTRARSGLVFVLLASLVILAADLRTASCEPPSESRAAFEAGLEKAHDFLGRERCKQGLALVEELLTQHEGAGYVLAHRVAIEDLVRRLAYGEAHPAPRAKDLVSGKLTRYIPSTGKIRVQYSPRTEQDLESFEGRLITFPARMKGPFTVTLEGDRLPESLDESPRLIVGNEDDPKTGRTQLWVLVAGGPKREVGRYVRWLPAKLMHRDEERSTELGSKEPTPVAIGKPYKLKLEVQSRKITGLVNGRRVGSGPKPPEIFGAIAFDAQNWTSFTIDGVVEPSWLQGRIDEVVQKNRAAFRETYDPSAYLPDWLLSVPSAAQPATAAPHWPEDVDPKHHTVLAKIEEGLERGDPLHAAREITRLGAMDVPASVAAYLHAIMDVRLYRLPKALERVEASLEQAPDFLSARMLKGLILSRLGRTEEADAVFEAAEAQYPDAPVVYERALHHFLFAGRLAKAQCMVERALSRRVSSERFDALVRALGKASAGPSWTRVHEHRSAHYHVFSDIDQATCRKASKTLEEAHGIYQGTLKRVARDGMRFKVYLFRGREGFATYMKDLGTLGSEVHMNVAGVYSPILKQLLIWNLPNREMMLRTVRHEGLHQYLDRLLPDIPIWFNEGLAEYYERGHRVAGKLYFGRPQHDLVELLAEKPLMPMTEFLALTRREFYRGGVRNYAQAWAFMHMLRHGGAPWKKLFRQLLLDLESLPMHEALQKSFGDLDPAELDEAFKAHLRSLSE